MTVRTAVIAIAVGLTAPTVGWSQQKPATDKEKIEALIKHVEGLTDAKFVRNDTEYDAKSAAKFLREKWKANDKDIKTAKDFIEKAADKSSTTGKPYLIRFKGGKEMTCGEYLTDELKKVEKRPAAFSDVTKERPARCGRTCGGW